MLEGSLKSVPLDEAGKFPNTQAFEYAGIRNGGGISNSGIPYDLVFAVKIVHPPFELLDLPAVLIRGPPGLTDGGVRGELRH